MSRGRWIRGAALAVLLAFAGAPARADELGAVGERYYLSGQYDKAIESFKAAYLKQPHPLFLYNIAQAERLLGRREEAITMYERFLHEAPDTAQRAKVEGYIKDLRAQIAAEEARRQAERKDREAAEQRAREAALVAARPEPAPGPASPAHVPVYRRWWFWTVLGGAVAAGVGTGVAVAVTRPTYEEPPAGVPLLMAGWQ